MPEEPCLYDVFELSDSQRSMAASHRDFSCSALSRWFNVGCRRLGTAPVADFGADEKRVAGLAGGGPSVLPHSHDEDSQAAAQLQANREDIANGVELLAQSVGSSYDRQKAEHQCNSALLSGGGSAGTSGARCISPTVMDATQDLETTPGCVAFSPSARISGQIDHHPAEPPGRADYLPGLAHHNPAYTGRGGDVPGVYCKDKPIL
jgi:hypothetical protein